jgi:hypothetical protein
MSEKGLVITPTEQLPFKCAFVLERLLFFLDRLLREEEEEEEAREERERSPNGEKTALGKKKIPHHARRD